MRTASLGQMARPIKILFSPTSQNIDSILIFRYSEFMISVRGTATIRDRGQLTIPEKIRGVLHWSTPNSVVSLSTNSKNELIIKPFEGKKQIDWTSIWVRINVSRSTTGKQGNLSKFIASDRESH